jgi:hypothetical protein
LEGRPAGAAKRKKKTIHLTLHPQKAPFMFHTIFTGAYKAFFQQITGLSKRRPIIQMVNKAL